MLLYLYLITLCKQHVHCDIIFTKLQAQFNSLSLSFIGNTKFFLISFSFIYIFSKFSYKKNFHLQMSIGIGNGTVVNDYLIDFIHITFIYCTEWLFLQSVPVSGWWKLSEFMQLLLSHGHLTFYEYFTITLHDLIKLSLQHLIILLFRVFFSVSGFLYFKGK
jgi:hypothetical protein